MWPKTIAIRRKQPNHSFFFYIIYCTFNFYFIFCFSYSCIVLRFIIANCHVNIFSSCFSSLCYSQTASTHFFTFIARVITIPLYFVTTFFAPLSQLPALSHSLYAYSSHARYQLLFRCECHNSL